MEKLLAPTSKPESKRTELVTMLEKFRPAISKLLPQHLTPDRILKLAQVSLSKTPGLIDCDPMSIVKSVIVFSQLGLDFDSPLGTGYLIPFRDGKTGKMQCTPIIGYRGFVELARRSGKVKSIEARAVFEGDEFDFCYGINQQLHHKPAGLHHSRDSLICVYALARFADSVQFEVMLKAEIENIRIGSKNGEGTIWSRYYVEMAKKTAIRRLAKLLPLSAELASAIVVDSAAENGEVPLLNGELNIEAEEVPSKTEQLVQQLQGKENP
jgi:recombination protein RecT